MKHLYISALRALGYNPINCREIGHTDLNRHAVFAADNEIIKFYGNCDGMDAQTHAQAEQKYSALACERGVKAPAILKTGIVEGCVYTISERLPGMPVTGDGEETWRETGRLLGAFHAAVPLGGEQWLARWLAYNESCAQTARQQPCSEKEAGIITAAVEKLATQAKPSLFSLLPMGTCHGDFSTRNVLAENGRITGVIDFELAHEGNVEQELACLCRTEFGNRPKRAKAFFAGYRETGFVAKDFTVRLPLYLAGEALFSCSWSFVKVPDHFRESVERLEAFVNG